MVRSMLKSKHMPKEFWAEAVACALYLSNWSPTRSLQKATPQEKWSGWKPTLSHIRVFGSIAYVHVPDETRVKLDDKSEKHVFIGYDAKSKGYKLYNPKSKKTVVSLDVKFDEDDSWNWETREENYNFLPFGDDNSNEIRVDNQPPTSPRSPALVHDDSSPQSSPEIPQKMRSLQDIYAETNEITDSTLYCLFSDSEPINFEEATQDKKWRLAMNEEMKAIQKNGTWELTTLLKEKQVVGMKWIYKIKKNERGEVEKYKARLVVKGFSQQHGVDYDEVFAPVARLETIRLIIALVAQKRWRIFQMDVKSAFLNGHLEEDVYVKQPEGYIIKGQKNKVLKLKKGFV